MKLGIDHSCGRIGTVLSTARPTPIEIAIGDALTVFGCRFRTEEIVDVGRNRNRRIDFTVEGSSACIGIEADGAEYHESSADFERDSEILSTGRVDRIYRIPGFICKFYRFHAVYFICNKERVRHRNTMFDVSKSALLSCLTTKHHGFRPELITNH